MVASYRVYVIQNPAGRLYIGLSGNVENRLRQHNDGQSRWTKGKGLWRLTWTSAAMSLSDARRLEHHLKKQKGGGGLWRTIGIERPGS